MNKIKAWIKRHPIITILLGLFLLMLVFTEPTPEDTPVAQEEPQESAHTPSQAVDTPEPIRMIVESEEFNHISQNNVNVWQSYEDRTLVGKINRGENVSLLEKDEENDYCKISDNTIVGWVACGWLQESR